MIVLGLDTSTAACSAAVWADGRVLARRYREMARGQSEALAPMVAEVMAEAGLGFADLGLVAVTVGPGAFTGLRIGLAAARAFGLAAGLEVAGVTTTEAVAQAIPDGERRGRSVLAAIESKRGDVYVQAFDAALAPLGPPAAATPAEAAALVAGPTMVVGDAAGRVLPLMAEAVAASSPGCPDAAVVAALAVRLRREGRALPPEPLYLRPADVTMPAGPAS